MCERETEIETDTDRDQAIIKYVEENTGEKS